MKPDSCDSNEALKSPENASTEDGVSRRALMRAGLSAGAVAATLKSNTVLATGYTGGCVRPSSYASMKANTAGSNYRNGQQGCYCPRPEFWRDHHRSECQNIKLSQCGLRNGVKTRCSDARRGVYSDHTFYSVLTMTSSTGSDQELAKYIIACYLTAQKYEKAPLSLHQCRQIWAGAGVWTPEGQKVEWKRDYTLQYLKDICV